MNEPAHVLLCMVMRHVVAPLILQVGLDEAEGQVKHQVVAHLLEAGLGKDEIALVLGRSDRWAYRWAPGPGAGRALGPGVVLMDRILPYVLSRGPVSADQVLRHLLTGSALRPTREDLLKVLRAYVAAGLLDSSVREGGEVFNASARVLTAPPSADASRADLLATRLPTLGRLLQAYVGEAPEVILGAFDGAVLPEALTASLDSLRAAVDSAWREAVQQSAATLADHPEREGELVRLHGFVAAGPVADDKQGE